MCQCCNSGVDGLFFRLLSEYTQSVFLEYQAINVFITKALPAERETQYSLGIVSLVRISDPGIKNTHVSYRGRVKPYL